ncbi:Protein transport protein sft2 [Rhizina undulata]
MAAESFRSQMNSMGWSRREEPVNTSASSPFLSKLQSLNPFGNGGYVRLPTTSSDLPPQLPAQTRQEEEGGWFACEFLAPRSFFGPLQSRGIEARRRPAAMVS